MKKAVVILVIILAIVSIFYLVKNNNTDKKITTPVSQDNNFKPDPSNATFNFTDGPITLSNGAKERKIVPDSNLVEEIALLENIAYGDINNDGKIDTATLLVRFGGGSGTFIYAGAFVSGPVNYKGTNTIFVGDRIKPQSISINNGVIVVKYLDRGADQAFSEEPTIQKTLEIIYSDGELKEQ